MTLLETQPAKPAVWTWYIVYCVVMALLYLLVMVAGGFFLAADPVWLEMEEEAVVLQIEGCVFLGMGLPLMVLFAAAPFLPKKPWVWIYGIILIGLGMTSPCCLPASIPLLIFWIKPETQQFFGRK